MIVKKTGPAHHGVGVPWSRRALLLSAAVVPAAAGLAATAAAQPAQKLAQQIVQYQQTPKDGHECDACVNFIPPDQCKLVEGPISPKGWCVAFAPKTG
jgi:hypothetical protein